MSSHEKTWRIVAAIAVSSLVLVGVAENATAKPSTDAKVSAAGLLVLDDFATGWKSTAPSSSNGASIAKNISTCKELVAAQATVRKHGAKAVSRDFKKSDETYRNTVVVLGTDAVAAKVYRAYSSDKGRACLAKVGERGAKDALAKSNNSTAGSAKVSSTLSTVAGPTVGTASTRAEVEFDITGGGLVFNEKEILDLVYVQSGRTVTVYEHATSFEQSDDHTLDQLIDVSQRRLVAALNGQPPPDPSQPAPLGTAQTAGDGAVVTVYSVHAGVPGKFDLGPFTVVDIQICAQRGPSSTLDANSFGLKLVFADNTSAKETFGGPDPEFNDATLSDGACARGNVAFSPATTAPLARVVYDTSFSETKPLAWAAS